MGKGGVWRGCLLQTTHKFLFLITALSGGSLGPEVYGLTVTVLEHIDQVRRIF